MVISKETALKLYKSMWRMRLCEESFIAPILSGEVRCPCHLYVGQEAIGAAFGVCWKKEDYVFSGHRSHGHYLAKGGNLKEMIAEIYCKETGCAKGRGGSMHIMDLEQGMLGSAPIVAGTISLALGAALASSIRKDSRVSATFFGDGATGEGVLYESLNFAALKKLPIIFACENNYYSTHLPIREIRVDLDIAKIGESLGIKSYLVDGNDAIASYQVVDEAMNNCRSGNGPAFIEFQTYRMRGHVGPDDNIQGDHTDIRPKEEVELWRKKDPIVRMEKYLLENNILDDESRHRIKNDIENEINDAIAFARNSPFPSKEDLSRHVFK
jgi:pyruvate dehydrogenase E1 component alpha subunit